MNDGNLMDNLTKIAAGIEAAKSVVTPALLLKLEQYIPTVRAMVTPGVDGKTTLDQATDVIAKLKGHPIIVNAIAALL